MRIALISDTHAGVRQDNELFSNRSMMFYQDTLLPYLEEHDIRVLVHLGDVFDRRRFVNTNTASRLRSDFLLPLQRLGVQCHFIAGNHDCFYKSTNRINALREIIGDRYTNFVIHDMDAQSWIFDDLKFLFIPWICEENRERILAAISDSDASVALGHLEIAGFEMYRGAVSSTGLDMAIFNKFDLVCSGHFHHKSRRGNIHYLGSHAEFTWADYDDERGFHIFDTETRELTFIPNQFKTFRKVVYDDTSEAFTSTRVDFSQFTDCIVKIIVKHCQNQAWLSKFVAAIESSAPVSVKIVESQDLSSDMSSEDIDVTESTLDICMRYINDIDVSTFYRDLDMASLKTLIASVYNASLVRQS